jgi:hypothetical protein
MGVSKQGLSLDETASRSGADRVLGSGSTNSRPSRGAGLFSGVKLLDLCKKEGEDSPTTVGDPPFQREERRSVLYLGEREDEWREGVEGLDGV